MNIQDLDIGDLHNMDIETKKAVIDAGVDVLLEEVQLMSVLTEQKKSTILSLLLGNLEKQIQELQNKEQYELCYFLNEIIWATKKKLDNK
jgi:septum formation inhibitor-activating ATPase MinD